METNKNTKNLAITCALLAGIGIIGTGIVMILPKNPASATVNIQALRQEQANYDLELLELKPIYRQYLQAKEEAERKMTEIETKGKSLREKIETLNATITQETNEGKEPLRNE